MNFLSSNALETFSSCKIAYLMTGDDECGPNENAGQGLSSGGVEEDLVVPHYFSSITCPDYGHVRHAS